MPGGEARMRENKSEVNLLCVRQRWTYCVPISIFTFVSVYTLGQPAGVNCHSIHFMMSKPRLGRLMRGVV